jgi:radical SAM protein with 4Fe4S-binding SPASM domain
VIDVGMVATPMTYFASYALDTGSSVMVTGSHNPPDYNGLKMVIDGATLAGDAIQRLRERLLREDLASGDGHYRVHDVSGAYLDRIAHDVTLERPMRIAVDCGNGVAGAYAPALYRRLGCEVVELFCDVDGHFPNHHPDPSQPENLADLIERLSRATASSASRSTATATASAWSRRTATSSTPTGSSCCSRPTCSGGCPARRSSTTSSRRGTSSPGSRRTAARRCCGRPATRSSRSR